MVVSMQIWLLSAQEMQEWWHNTQRGEATLHHASDGENVPIALTLKVVFI